MMSRRQRNYLGALLAFVLGALVLVLTCWPVDSEPTINLPATAEQGFSFMASDEFTKLPDYRQEAYRREVQRLVAVLPEDRRAALFASYRGSAEMAKGMKQLQFNPIQPAMKEYFESQPEKRQAVLDKYIDQMERFRKLGGLGRAANPNERPEASPEMRGYMRQRLESQFQEGNPQETGKMMEFMKAFRQRRIDRGLPVP